MKIEVKAAPKKFEPKTIEITVESFEELKEFKKNFKTCFSGYGSPIGQLYRTVNDLYKQALDAGEVDCDF
ncbi:MAG: hypothetical protein AB7D39_11805 [Pseudodesulfovibrio sp.]|uniref:hypothetical protein n=1 Tax=Pseudodesulfovibrio sp. TaxID=2035812 RepID=UPI003D13A62D